MRILLVDDEPALRELLRTTFEGAHVQVDEAASGVEAEARIRRRRPDVIVLDLRMPGMSGTELCARLKGDEKTKLIPIVLLTGADAEEARRAQRSGAEALVRKPFSPLDLLAIVERLAGGGGTPARGVKRTRAADEEVLLYARDLRHLLEIERGQRELLQDSYLETVTALATALESKDTHTRAHSHRVERYAVELLAAIDVKKLESDPAIRYGFLLHDVGKIGIPDGILQKPGPLTPAERRRMQTHTVLGEQMLGGVARTGARSAGPPRVTRSSRRRASSSIRTSWTRSASARSSCGTCSASSPPRRESHEAGVPAFGTGICCQSTILPPWTTKTAAAFAPGASQRWFGRWPSTKVAVTRSPFTVSTTIRPAHGSEALNAVASARLVSRASRPGCTTRAFGAKSAAAARLSFVFSAWLQARTTCAGEAVCPAASTAPRARRLLTVAGL